MSASHYTPQPFDNFIPVIPTQDPQFHTVEHPFCFHDSTCGCHEDPTLIAEVAKYVEAGLLTPQEATRTVKGEQL